MPLGIERINPRKRPPNANITFITALPGQDNGVALDYLERIAAMVFPIMRDNGLAVMSVDEFPANVEFWGRNFNAGEVIQLVLKNPNTGAWLPFSFVLGVMIHELAHIKQMNHSRAFWSVNNKFSAQLRVLRAKGYTGEGFWSTGRTLLSEQYTFDQPLAEKDMPKSLCGGTYRSYKKRESTQDASERAKRPKITYAERQQRRKERKFGSGEGEKVGADDDTRSVLEKGKKSKAAPRIAQSVRGRELRAAAAVKRLEGQKVEKAEKVEEVSDESGSSDNESTGDWDENEKKVDVGGGKYLVPVSLEDDGDLEQDWMKRELVGLKDACGRGTVGEYFDEEESMSGSGKEQEQGQSRGSSSKMRANQDTVDLTSDDLQAPPPNNKPLTPNPPPNPRYPTLSPSSRSKAKTSSESSKATCTACSFVNDPTSTLCCVCANVLNPGHMKNAWKCSCYGDLPYMNPGDAGICGVCGKRDVRREQ